MVQTKKAKDVPFILCAPKDSAGSMKYRSAQVSDNHSSLIN